MLRIRLKILLNSFRIWKSRRFFGVGKVRKSVRVPAHIADSRSKQGHVGHGVSELSEAADAGSRVKGGADEIFFDEVLEHHEAGDAGAYDSGGRRAHVDVLVFCGEGESRWL